MRASVEASQRAFHIQKNSTQAEALRLKGALSSSLNPLITIPNLGHPRADELAALEALHLWHTATVCPELFEFVYASRFHVHVPCARFDPLKDQIRITKTKEMLKQKDQFPRFTDLTIQVAQQRLAAFPSDLSAKHVRFFNLPPSARVSVGWLPMTLIRIHHILFTRSFRAWATSGRDADNCANISPSSPSNTPFPSILNPRRTTVAFQASSRRPRSCCSASKRRYIYPLF